MIASGNRFDDTDAFIASYVTDGSPDEEGDTGSGEYAKNTSHEHEEQAAHFFEREILVRFFDRIGYAIAFVVGDVACCRAKGERNAGSEAECYEGCESDECEFCKFHICWFVS